MSKKLTFDGRVAIITGAGAGLGRSYALLLASRGAKVVVNDLGGSVQGSGSSTRAADSVVEEIRKAGGTAVANYESVEFGDKIVKTAIDIFGKVDIVINNAGILRDVSFVKMKDADFDLVHKVHVRGAYSVTKAAWPYMREQKYGRVLFISSAAGLYGNFGQANYSAAKLGVLGLANTLSIEGKKDNIFINTIAPLAASRMTETILPPNLLEALKPDYVAPVVAYLVHESCQETGGIYELGAGFLAKIRLQRARGVTFPIDQPFTPENVRDGFAEALDFSEGATNPSNTNEASSAIFQRVLKPSTKSGPSGSASAQKSGPSGSAPAQKSGPSGSAPAQKTSGPVSQIFSDLQKRIKENPSLVKQIGGVYIFVISGPEEGTWVANLQEGGGSVSKGKPDKNPAGSCQITVSGDDFVQLMTGKLEPMNAFTQGKVKVDGNLGLAMKLQSLTKGLAKL